MVECDSIATASSLYEELEHIETHFSIDALDIRYIPDDTPAFTSTYPRPPESEATEVNLRGYQPPTTFQSALRHTQVKCTWDETPAPRTKALRKRFSAVEMADLDLKVRRS